jgi:N-methylhydantoinase B
MHVTTQSHNPTPPDAISLAVFRALLESVAEEMGITLQRAALSPNIRERLDFSCAVFDAAGRMVAQAAHIPVHLGSMPASVAAALAAFETFAVGDVVVLNDPYRGGTHLPDITMVSPVFIEGEPRFFVASRAHHADVGGMSPGSLPLSTSLYQEGLIIPPIKLMVSGWINEGVFALIAANSRAPQERIGDLEAQLAAQRVGERRILSLVVDHGRAAVETHAAALIDYARRLTAAALRRIPAGSYSFADALEGDGQSTTPLPICVRATVTPDAAADTPILHLDFADSAPQTLGNVNAVTAIVRSAAYYCARLLVQDDDLPMNQGVFECVAVDVPPRSLLNPDFPSAVAVGNTETSQRVVDVILGALAQALPDVIPAASQGTMNNVTIGNDDFVYYETLAGGHGGGVAGRGLSGRHSHMTNTRNTPIEALEAALPLRVLEYSLRDNSGGKGTGRGGDGLRRRYLFLTACIVTINSERRAAQPYGLRGGGRGAAGRNLYRAHGAAEAHTLGAKVSVHAQAGDELTIETPGGGGWGDPSDGDGALTR